MWGFGLVLVLILMAFVLMAFVGSGGWGMGWGGRDARPDARVGTITTAAPTGGPAKDRPASAQKAP